MNTAKNRRISNLRKKMENVELENKDDLAIAALENNIKDMVDSDKQRLELVGRLEENIQKLTDKKVIAEMKQENYKIWFDVFSLSILFLSSILTVVEAIKNEINMEKADDHIINFFKITPLLISSAIGLLTAIIKFKKFQDKLENNTKAIEKSNFTTFRMKKLQEDLHFANRDDFMKIKEIYKEEIFPLYNQTEEELVGNMQHKDIIKYTAIKKKIENEGMKKMIKLKKEENTFGTILEHTNSESISQKLKLKNKSNNKSQGSFALSTITDVTTDSRAPLTPPPLTPVNSVVNDV